MKPFKAKMLSSSVIPIALFVGLGMASVAVMPEVWIGPAQAQKKGCNPCAARNPCAAKRGCNPCAAKKGCNPCAAKGGCNPCAANPCNPCAGGAQALSNQCVVPRLVRLAASNPCAAKSCNPCAAKNCNPCAAKRGCNPCAAKRGCSPCAAKNPCAANPCNPCGAAQAVELSDAESAKIYDCMIEEMQAAYVKSGNGTAKAYTSWRRYSRVAYVSGTHGNRFVQNYANTTAQAYGAFEKAGVMPAGAVLAKDSFIVTPKGRVGIGPLFLMEKMPAGFKKASGDWKYSTIMPTGAVMGVTNAKNSKAMNFCYECHMSVAEEQDSMWFLPEDYRTK